MQLSEKLSEALMELAGARKSVDALMVIAINKLEQDLLSTAPDADLLLAARLKLEGAKVMRSHINSLMKPTDR